MAGTICAFRPKVSLYCMDHFILIVGTCLLFMEKVKSFSDIRSDAWRRCE